MNGDLVLTPGGFRHKSLVNPIDPGHGLTRLETGELADLEIATAKVTRLAKPPVLQAQFAVHGPGGAPQAAQGPAPGALPNGWQTYAWWDSGEHPITYFSTEWTVPPAPVTSHGQTI